MRVRCKHVGWDCGNCLERNSVLRKEHKTPSSALAQNHYSCVREVGRRLCKNSFGGHQNKKESKCTGLLKIKPRR